MNPRPESRISALEKRATTLEATIEELSSDTAEELKAIRQDIKASYKEIGDFFVRLDEGMETVKATMATKEDLRALETRIEQVESDVRDIKATMATKNDIAALETRLVDTIKQLWQHKPEGER